MAVNGQYNDPPFGMSGAIADTGAAGSVTVPPDTTVGAVLANVTVTPNYGSSQVAQPVVPVTAGDTCSLSSDAPVPATGDPLTGLSLAQVTQTGAGQGSVGHFRHPDNTARA